MSYLEKHKTLVKRDAEGKLLPLEVILELLDDKPVVKLIPLLKGELQAIYVMSEEDKKQADIDMILNNVIEPKYTEDEIKDIIPEIYGALTTAIISISTNMSQTDINDATIKSVIDDIDLKKKKE